MGSTPSALGHAHGRPRLERLRDQQLLGNALPLWKIGWSHNLQFKRLNAYVLIDKTFGNKIYNTDRHWSWGDFMTARMRSRMASRSETAKPIGYYWRSAAPEAATGIGGTYDVLGPNTISYEDGGYTKLRELSLSYNVGAIKHVFGDWSITAVGRNLYTWTKFTGWDPDAGAAGGSGQLASGALVSAQTASSYPANAQFHDHALLQVLTCRRRTRARDATREVGMPRPREKI